MGEIEESGRSLWHSVKKSFHLDDYSKILNPAKPLPHRNSAVVEEFIASDPVHGPVVCIRLQSTVCVFFFSMC